MLSIQSIIFFLIFDPLEYRKTVYKFNTLLLKKNELGLDIAPHPYLVLEIHVPLHKHPAILDADCCAAGTNDETAAISFPYLFNKGKPHSVYRNRNQIEIGRKGKVSQSSFHFTGEFCHCCTCVARQFSLGISLCPPTNNISSNTSKRK